MPTFSEQDNAALLDLLERVEYVETPTAEDVDLVDDPDYTLEAVLEAARGVTPNDPQFDSVVRDARAVVAERLAVTPEDPALRQAETLLADLAETDWSLRPEVSDLTAAAGPRRQSWRDQLRIPKGNQKRSGRWTFTPWKHMDDLVAMLEMFEDDEFPDTRLGVSLAEVELQGFSPEQFDVHDGEFTAAAERAGLALSQTPLSGDPSVDATLAEAAAAMRAFGEVDWSLFEEETDIGLTPATVAVTALEPGAAGSKWRWESPLPSDEFVSPAFQAWTSADLREGLRVIADHPVAPSPTMRRKRASYMRELQDRANRDVSEQNNPTPEPPAPPTLPPVYSDNKALAEFRKYNLEISTKPVSNPESIRLEIATILSHNRTLEKEAPSYEQNTTFYENLYHTLAALRAERQEDAEEGLGRLARLIEQDEDWAGVHQYLVRARQALQQSDTYPNSEETLRERFGPLDVTTPESIVAAIGAFDALSEDSLGPQQNCVLATAAYELQRRGINVYPQKANRGRSAVAAYHRWFNVRIDDWKPLTRQGRLPERKYESTVATIKEHFSPPSRGAVQTAWRTNGAHIWNWEYTEEDGVRFFDAQTGAEYPRGDGTWSRMKSNSGYVARLDDKPVHLDTSVLAVDPEVAGRLRVPEVQQVSARINLIQQQYRVKLNEITKAYTEYKKAPSNELLAAYNRLVEEARGLREERDALINGEADALQAINSDIPYLSPGKMAP